MNTKTEFVRNTYAVPLYSLETGDVFRKKMGEQLYRVSNMKRTDDLLVTQVDNNWAYYMPMDKEVVVAKELSIVVEF